MRWLLVVALVIVSCARADQAQAVDAGPLTLESKILLGNVRGRIDHLGLQAASLEAFEEIRRRLIARGAADEFVTDFGAILSLFFTDPDGLEGEVCVANPDAVLMLSWPTPIAKFFHEAEAEHWAPPLGYYAKHHVADPGFGPIFGDYIKDRFYSINSWVIAGGLNQSAADNNLPGLQFWKMLTKKYTGYDLLNFHFKYTYGHHITQSAVACSTIFIDVARKLGPNLTRPAFIAALESQPWETGMGQVLKWPHGDHGQEPYSFNKEPVYLWTGAPDGTFEVKRVYPDAVTNS